MVPRSVSTPSSKPCSNTAAVCEEITEKLLVVLISGVIVGVICDLDEVGDGDGLESSSEECSCE